MKQISRLLLLVMVLLTFSVVAGAVQDTSIPALVQFRLVLDSPEWPPLRVIYPLGNTLYIAKEVIIDNDMIINAEANKDAISGEYGIEITLNGMSRQSFKKFTRANLGKRLVVLIDGKLADVVTIREPIDGGTCFVRNKQNKPFTKTEAERLSLSRTFIGYFLTLKDTENLSPLSGCLTQSAHQKV